MRHLGLVAIIIIGLTAPVFAADSGSKADLSAIRAVFPAKLGACTQRVDHIAVQGAYALATVLQTGNCDTAAVWVLKKSSSWKKLGAIGGVPDTCTVEQKGVPRGIARPLVSKFNGGANLGSC